MLKKVKKLKIDNIKLLWLFILLAVLVIEAIYTMKFQYKLKATAEYTEEIGVLNLDSLPQ